MKNILYLLIICVFLVTCKTKRYSETTINFRFEKLSENSKSSVVKSYSLVPLETTEQSYLTKIVRLDVWGDKIFILEYIGPRRNLYIFSREGKYINKLSAQGRGPREYQSIIDFDIHPTKKYISVLDPGLRKIKNYDSNSNYIDERAFDSWGKEFKYFTAGEKVFTTISTKASKFSKQGNNFDIEVYGENKELLYSALPFKDAVSIGAGNQISMFRIGNSISYRQVNTNIVYSIGPDTIRTKYILDFPYPVMPGNELENAFFKGKKIFEKYVYFVNYFETEQMILVQFTHDKNPYWGIYDKRSKRSVLFHGEIDPSCKCDVSLRVIGTWEKGFVIETDYSKITKVIQTLDPEKSKCKTPQMTDIINKLDMTSNPVLLFVEFDI